jgi:antitoxin ParD1/3/4
MRTNIEIDDALMSRVMSTGEYKTKREAVEAGLKLVTRQKAYQDILAAKGQLKWVDPTIQVTAAPEQRKVASKKSSARKKV